MRIAVVGGAGRIGAKAGYFDGRAALDFFVADPLARYFGTELDAAPR